MNVAIFGGTGYLGSYLVDALIGDGHHPVLLVRPGSDRKVIHPEKCTLIPGDVNNGNGMHEVISQCQSVIYNVGILREFPDKNITFESLQYRGACHAMDIAAELGVERFLLTSANGAKSDGTAYQRTKYQAETHLQTSGLAGTVFRPSVIFGDPRGGMEFATQLCNEIIRIPVPAPFFYQGLLPINAGTFRMSPIHVKDMAEIYVKALVDPEAVGKTYILCGPDVLEWRAIIKTIGHAVGRNKFGLPVSVPAMKVIAGILERFPSFPLTRDQLTMLIEGNTGDSSSVFQAYGIQPTPFNETSLAYLNP